MLDTNPTQIQQAPAWNTSATPLFLLHDGGGTIFNYFMLGNLGRDVYGIHDTKFDTEEGWKGGLTEMASLYVSLIKSVRVTGPILLGGWSLGGMVSLEIARILASAKDGPVVVGLILIDSPYTQPWRENRHRMVDFTPEFQARTPEKIRAAITKRMEVADDIIDNWVIPSWSDVRSAGYSKLPCLYQPLQGEAKTLQKIVTESGVSKHVREVDPPAAAVVPPAVLLRSVEWVPKPATYPDGLVDVDLSRHSNTLEWEEYPYDFLRAIYDIEGHHFDLFDGDSRLDRVTMLVKQACSKLESKTPFIRTL